MTTTTALLNALSAHQGRSSGIAAKHLAERLQVPPRRLRVLISQAREDGIAICGQPSSGYFMPVTAQELNASTAFLEHRALKSLLLASRMKKVAMPVLLGQLLLNQA